MIFQDTVDIEAEAPRVWDFLLDVECLAACVPGLEQVVRVDEVTFDGVISAAVGPISGKFSFRAQIVQSTPPSEMLTELRGTDSVTRSAIDADVRMTLDTLAPRHTRLAYHATVHVKGRLAILGEMVLRTTAVLLLEEFMRRLRQRLETPALDRSTA